MFWERQNRGISIRGFPSWCLCLTSDRPQRSGMLVFLSGYLTYQDHCPGQSCLLPSPTWLKCPSSTAIKFPFLNRGGEQFPQILLETWALCADFELLFGPCLLDRFGWLWPLSSASGAGIGGLTTAGHSSDGSACDAYWPVWDASAALSTYPDIDVEIYEAATQLTELGAGIGIFPRKTSTILVHLMRCNCINTFERSLGGYTETRYWRGITQMFWGETERRARYYLLITSS